ncbi:hypothetical protein CG435_08625 [Pantoea ananatis]|uniref:ATP-grasp domain-containing protein n=1 Tax=Pantoea ananas TaxID=553 RepID=UPI000CF47E9D|nr:hypothetical protein [Pantoea ananatis]PQL00993.1 hypothetical protein CG435_08625 [Pantoea ananatis]
MNLLIIDYEALNTNPVTDWYKGHDCYLITSEQSFRSMDENTRSSFKEIVAINSIHPENDDLIFYHAEKLKNHVEFDHVIGVREFDLLPAAVIRNNWSLPGASIESIEAYRDKGIMKKILKEKLISVPDFKIITTAIDIINFIKDNGYPVLLKPRTSKRARGISVLHNDNDLYHALHKGLKQSSEDLVNMMVEEFVSGPMYHIDGVVINNEIKFIWPSLYVSNCMGFPDGNYISSCLLSPDDDLYIPLVKYVSECISALPSPVNFAFHAEVFYCTDGTLKLCEIAARAGGGPVMTSIETVFNFNPKETAFMAYLDARVETPVIKKEPENLSGWIIIPNNMTEAYIENIPESCPFPQVTNYKVFSKGGDYFSNERQVVAEVALRGKNSEEIISSISEIMEWFYYHTQWSTRI